MTKLKDVERHASIEGIDLPLGCVILRRDDGYFPAASLQLTRHFKRMCTDSARAWRELDGEDHHSWGRIPRVPLHGPFHFGIGVGRCDYTDRSRGRSGSVGSHEAERVCDDERTTGGTRVSTKPATAGAEVATKRPRVGLFGPLIGRNAGRVTTQGEILGDLLEADGYGVVRASSLPNRYGRLLDILWTILSRNRDVDVLLIQAFGGPSFVVEDAASWLGHRFRKPTIFQLHGGAMPQFLRDHPRWGRRVLGRADQLVVPSAYLARALQEHDLRAHIVPNIVDAASYPFRLRRQVRPRLMWMRAFHSIYHPEMAVRVLARLRAVMPEATLVMGGEEKGLGEATRQLAEALNVADAIRFVGFLEAAEKHREGSQADIFLNTNRIDNQPVSVIEACAMGLPVVATAVGGVPDLLEDGETGLLVPDGDDAAMAKAILRLVNEPALSERLSANGRELALRFAPEGVLVEWRGVLDEVGGGKPGAR